MNKKNIITIFSMFLFVVLPASPNYKLDSLDVNGGGAIGNSTNYKTETTLGEAVQTNNAKTNNYQLGAGLLFTQQANTPTVTMVNTGDWYSKLLITINQQNNSASGKYSIAISTDNFVTTQYVQSDGTVGAVLGSEDIQTYTAWGGALGSYVIGLNASTTYYVKVKAHRGTATESPYGPVVSAATSGAALSFDIDTAATDSETAAPYTIDIGTITPNTVTAAANLLWFDIATNAQNGATVYMQGVTNNLTSSNGSTIASTTGNLTALSSGYGVQVNTLTQTTGGPLVSVAPYNGTLNNVGNVTTTMQPIVTSTTSIVGGRVSAILKAKVDAVTVAADYSQTINAILVPNF
jgi:hypothetical protein